MSEMDNENNEFTERRNELSNKFIRFGEALRQEGISSGDESIELSSKILIVLGGAIHDLDDMDKLAYLAELFASKKIVENMGPDPFDAEEIRRVIMDSLPPLPLSDDEEGDEDYDEEFDEDEE